MANGNLSKKKGLLSELSDENVEYIAAKVSENLWDGIEQNRKEISKKISSEEKGAANGVAELDENGRIPSTQLPSYVDDVVEGYISADETAFYEDEAFTSEITPESGKIYVSNGNITYRWSGTKYVEISKSIGLGETTDSAYSGDKGKQNAENIKVLLAGLEDTKFMAEQNAAHTVTTREILDDFVKEANNKFEEIDSKFEDTDSNCNDVEATAGEAWLAIQEHRENKENPHAVSKEQLGLENVNNTADMDKPVSTAVQEALGEKLSYSDVIDDLMTTDTKKPLSANQGRLLNEKIGDIDIVLDSIISIQNKLMGVSE